jgi:general secretion pathway protein M
MAIKLSKSGQRAAALLILLGVIAILFSVTILPVLIASSNLRDSIDELGFRMQKYQNIASMEVPLKNQLTRLESQRVSKEDLLNGESTAITGANLQELFKQRVQQSGGRLQSTQILPESYQGSLERIAIKANFTGSIKALQKTLYNIEYQQPLLFVDNIEIRSRTTRRRSRRTQTQPTEMLTVTMEIAGYRRSEGPR